MGKSRIIGNCFREFIRTGSPCGNVFPLFDFLAIAWPKEWLERESLNQRCPSVFLFENLQEEMVVRELFCWFLFVTSIVFSGPGIIMTFE